MHKMSIPFPLIDCDWSPEPEINIPFGERKTLSQKTDQRDCELISTEVLDI